MDEFIERKVMHWIRLILARQPDAEFVFIGTKDDMLKENAITERLLKESLVAKLKDVETAVYEMKKKESEKRPELKISNSPMRAEVDTTTPNVLYTSSTSPASV
jgi:hypothetical protein